MTTITEADVKEAALAWLADLGWSVAHGPDIADVAVVESNPSPSATTFETVCRRMGHSDGH